MRIKNQLSTKSKSGHGNIDKKGEWKMKGSLYMEIKAPDGTVIYRGNGKETRNFTLNIPESGVYTIVACAKHAKRGMIQINKKSNCF